MAKRKRLVIALDKIELAPAMQARTAIRTATVQEYAEAMREGIEFPPIDVMAMNAKGGARYCVIDGWHRVMAAREIGIPHIDAHIIECDTPADAMWLAAGANISHGLRRSNADKARAVTLAIQAKPDATYEQIATQCGVSVSMVGAYFNAMNEVDAADADEANDLQQVNAAQDVRPVLMPAQQRMRDAKVAIDAAIDTVEHAQTVVRSLTESNEGAFVNAQSVLSDLQNALNGLQHALPHKECPLCNGEGCETCRMLGWVSKKQWQLIPAAMRGR